MEASIGIDSIWTNQNWIYFPIGDLDIRIANKYRLGRKIGGGSFGDIYVGKFSILQLNYSVVFF